MTTAMIMAGGHGERMRVTGSSTPKPLVPVHGVPLLERNLCALLKAGLRDIVVAVPSHTPEIGRFVQTRGQAITDALDARLRVLEETQPLGNIGPAAEVELEGADLLVVYADNLTALDLNALLLHHRRADATLTCAVHLESFRTPFGEVQVRDGVIVGYVEKPERRILIASGVVVLSASAVARLPRGRAVEIRWLVDRLLEEGEKVAAFLHDAPWIDVNDAASVARAERLVGEHREAFACRGEPRA
ncbi:MAG: NDP-sugar synthase [Gemmatimonadales bacterium]|nr:NDP-sugar synthase [Gemmatimonadales bacterium]